MKHSRHLFDNVSTSELSDQLFWACLDLDEVEAEIRNPDNTERLAAVGNCIADELRDYIEHLRLELLIRAARSITLV